MTSSNRFHWAEGMKYALEGIKTLFILNGAATVSILTFIGNRKDSSDFLVCAMASFAFGAALGPIALFSAYLTQLNYGNAEVSQPAEHWTTAIKFHWGTYISVLLGWILFIIGVMFAIFALKVDGTT